MASREYTMPKETETVITNLADIFGSILTLDIIRSVAQNCRFDMKKAIDQLLEIAGMNQKKDSSPALRETPQSSTDDIYQKELHIQRVIEFVKEGWKVLILLRGLPGSGKSYLANMIFKEAVPSYKKQDFILSTDDYFCKSGTYNFNPHDLQDAHTWNQRRCFINMKKGISPIIIDNTNTQLWEMRPYCLMATEFGYCIEVLEPPTTWANKIQVLADKNNHGVSKDKLIEMLARYERDLTPDKLSRLCDLKYKVTLPQRRRIPSLVLPKRETCNDAKENSPAWNSPLRMYSADKVMESAVPLEYVHPIESKHGDSWTKKKTNDREYIHEFKTTDYMRDKTDSQTRLASVDDLLAFQNNKLDHLKPGTRMNALFDMTMDTSGEVSRDRSSIQLQKELSKLAGEKINFAGRAGELEKNKDTSGKASNPYSSNLKAWGLTEKALVSWDIVSPLPAAVNSPQSPSQLSKPIETNVRVSKVNQSTNTSFSDFNLAKNCLPEEGVTILPSQNRNITKGIMPKPLTPPKRTLVDKSSMTNEEVLVAALKRENPSAEHLEKLIQLFPGIPREFLSDFYDKCVRDLNWTVDLLMENGPELLMENAPENICTSQIEIETKNEDTSTSEKSEAKIDNEIIQDEKMDDLISFEVEQTEETPLIQEDSEKIEKELLKQQERETLKKFLEESVDIKKEHYSEKLWQIVNFRRGTPVKSEDTQTKQDDVAQATVQNTPSSSLQNDVCEDMAVFISDDESDANDADGEDDNLVEVNLGQELVDQLQKMFGGSVIEQFQPVVQMPESFARQLHALYLESMCLQMDAQRETMEAFLKEDEAFAKKLQEEEEHTLIQKQQTSNLKEIMDEQLALNLYQKDVDKWKDISPDDLASKLTRQKLLESFPDVDKDLLVEILQAHDNSYKQTVETLLDSVDYSYVQESQANLKEPPISDKTLQEMKSAREAVTKMVNETEIRTAVSYRKEANEHMYKRRENLQKVQMYQQRGMNEVAAFYANIARQQLQLAELANQKASCRFLEENAGKLTSTTTLDLHFLYVKEALLTLDIFIDHHISSLAKSKKGSENLYIITGRGLRSVAGVAKLKPAVLNRLRNRNIQYHQMNPGLFRIKVHKNLLMSTHLKNDN